MLTVSEPVSKPLQSDQPDDSYVFKTLHGRSFSNQSDAYFLPGDETEHRRLDIQSKVLRLLNDGLYVSKDLVRHALREGQPQVPAVLDIGTGSGRWAIEMAEEFSHARILGVDLVPPSLLKTETVPTNCRFEVKDASLPMENAVAAFNVVHCRSAEGGIVEFEDFLYQVARTLRPHGVLFLIGGGPGVRGEDLQPYPTKTLGEPGFSWVEHIFSAFIKAYQDQGTHTLSHSDNWHSWLEQNPNYQDVVTEDKYVPLGPWKTGLSEREKMASEYMRADIAIVLHAFKPLLIASGWHAAAVDEAVENGVQELREMSIHGLIRWRYTTAVRTDSDWKERAS